MFITKIKRFFLGEPLTWQMAVHQLLPKWKALAILASDALSSVAYATEEMLIPLAAFSLAATNWSILIAFGICLLLIILTLSYRQTIDAYPGGGGAYIVSKENLGVNAGLIAGASLLIDYVLTVAVSVAAGVENIVSAFPLLSGHKEFLGAFFICLLMLLNLRGVKDSANFFVLPTYFFIVSFFLMVFLGFQTSAPPADHANLYPELPLFLLFKAFASGCSALTGIEAISNGIPLFKHPAQTNAKRTLIWMSMILGSLFLGMTFLAHRYHLLPKLQETVISQLAHLVFGNGIFYYLIQLVTTLILILAANTSYADFPRLSSLLAKDRYLPRQLASVGDRLVFSNGILGLSVAAILLIVLFEGQTHHLIPLYSIGVFLSFTLSQSGMVLHHCRMKEQGWIFGLFCNGLGACTTFVILIITSTTKFLSGAWMFLLFLPLLVMFFRRIHDHYLAIGSELALPQGPLSLTPVKHKVLIPISGIHRGVIEALRYALSISQEVQACYVEIDPCASERIRLEWAKRAPEIPLVILKSPYRSVLVPFLDHLEKLEKSHDLITVMIPEFVTSKWWHQILHNQTAFLIRAALLFRPGKVVTSVRYHLHG